MNRINKIAQDRRVQKALAGFDGRISQITDLTIAIQQIPAPTFHEAERAAFIQAQFEALGLQDVSQDELHNVYGRYPAASLSSPHPVVVSAHSDTVFPPGTDLTVQRNGRTIHGPGIGDNSAGVAGILTLAQTLAAYDLSCPADIWFVANVGEEGLGDLCGMRRVVERFGEEAVYIVVEGGLYGQISHRGIGVQRYRIQVETPGGHSWGNFGQPSAIHVLGRLIAAIDDLPAPRQPKTTYNVGVIEGGTSINTIAQKASLLLDLRSEDSAALADLVAAVTALVQQFAQPAQVSVTMEMIGNRPAGGIPADTPLVQWAEAALRFVGRPYPHFITSSTDANIPLSLGYTAVCVGLTESNNAHRLDEYLDTQYLAAGMSQLLLLTL
ncbi:MAG TPA: M20/M25/M40 family metallo-hydrolase, partial [Anaerolineae bacterium]|nr:M20/M25/M40 family metallo-hydrolase [Anaerolineae bacterium]